MVRQAAVTPFARLMSRIVRDLVHAFGVAPLTERVRSERYREVMRLMAARARHVVVKSVIGPGDLMTAAARLRADTRRHACWVRLVAALTAPGTGNFRMIGVKIPMAGRTSGCGRRLHVVRRVAIAAGFVRGNARAADDVQILMAGATRDRRLALEVVRPVTADALRVTALEQGRRRDDRFVRRVAAHARAERVGCRAVLVPMTRLARFGHALALRSVGRRDVVMTRRAGG
jgi:hypothetical protein